MSAGLILIIEDDADLRAMMADALHSFGYRTVTAENGLTGLDALDTHQPDLILCDRAMPTMTGDSLLSRLRGLYPQYADIPFIFVTALSRHDRGPLDAMKPFAVLGKPIDFTDLEQTIRRALEKQPRKDIA